MIAKRTLVGAGIAAAGWIPSAALAEVSDKMPSIPTILILGLLVGSGLFLLARFRWWLGIVLSPVPVLFIAQSIALWNEIPMREALLHEQGGIYFGALGLQGALMLGAITVGSIVGYKRRNKLANASEPQKH